MLCGKVLPVLKGVTDLRNNRLQDNHCCKQRMILMVGKKSETGVTDDSTPLYLGTKGAEAVRLCVCGQPTLCRKTLPVFKQFSKKLPVLRLRC